MSIELELVRAYRRYLEHLGGKHNQKSHGNRFGSVGAIKANVKRLGKDKEALKRMAAKARKDTDFRYQAKLEREQKQLAKITNKHGRDITRDIVVKAGMDMKYSSTKARIQPVKNYGKSHVAIHKKIRNGMKINGHSILSDPDFRKMSATERNALLSMLNSGHAEVRLKPIENTLTIWPTKKGKAANREAFKKELERVQKKVKSSQ